MSSQIVVSKIKREREEEIEKKDVTLAGRKVRPCVLRVGLRERIAVVRAKRRRWCDIGHRNARCTLK